MAGGRIRLAATGAVHKATAYTQTVMCRGVTEPDRSEGYGGFFEFWESAVPLVVEVAEPVDCDQFQLQVSGVSAAQWVDLQKRIRRLQVA